MTLTVGSLFSGIGGLELGLERAGMRVVFQVENDPFCQRVLAKHWPNVARYEDVRDVGRHNLQAVDLLCGGFPCQDVSLAGKRAGLEGERTTLWSEFARIIGEIRPRWVLAENVPGLLSSDAGRFFGNVLRDLAALGYDAEWDCIPAVAVGAPHRRDRVFIIAYPNGCQQGGRIISQRQQDQRDTDPTGDGSQGAMADAKGACTGDGVYCAPLQGAQSRVGLGGRNCRRRQQISTETVADAKGTGASKVFRQGRGLSAQSRRGDRQDNPWSTEPDVGRVADGIPSRVDRLRALGNAVVPQVAEWIGRRIMEAESA